MSKRKVKTKTKTKAKSTVGRKANGQLKKGYTIKGGRVVKAGAKRRKK